MPLSRAAREEIANSITHGLGFALSIVGLPVLVWLAARSGDPWRMVACSVYGVTLILLYASSTLYHAFRTPRVKRVFQIFDYAAIYLLIAGTYTPFTVVNLRGPSAVIFGVVWGLGILGVVSMAIALDIFKYVAPAVFVAMGWLVMIAIKPLLGAVSTAGIVWLVAGGLAYTLGVIFGLGKSALRTCHLALLRARWQCVPLRRRRSGGAAVRPLESSKKLNCRIKLAPLQRAYLRTALRRHCRIDVQYRISFSRSLCGAAPRVQTEAGQKLVYAITLLKPVCGLEPRLEENLESFFAQEYPAFEIIFGARNNDDPAIRIVERLRDKYPMVPLKIVFSGEPQHPNAKVCSLEKMIALATTDYYVISDSDVHVEPNYIREIIAPFADSKVGVVTCLYRGVPTGGLWSRLEALGMSVEMTAGVVSANLLEGIEIRTRPHDGRPARSTRTVRRHRYTGGLLLRRLPARQLDCGGGMESRPFGAHD